jgi:hypothetical protein
MVPLKEFLKQEIFPTHSIDDRVATSQGSCILAINTQSGLFIYWYYTMLAFDFFPVLDKKFC